MIADSGYSADYIRRKFQGRDRDDSGRIPDRLGDYLARELLERRGSAEAFCE